MSWTSRAATGLISLMVCGLCSGTAAVSQAQFDDANRLYEEGRYLEAIQAYEALMTNGTSAALAFNTGNAHFKAGHIGQAIAYYRMAAGFEPRDPDIRANLEFARAQAPDAGYEPGWLEAQAHRLSFGEWAALTSVAIWMFFGLLTLSILRPSLAGALRSWTWAALALAAGASVWLFGVVKKSESRQFAVVTVQEAVIRHGPFTESESAFVARDGTELLVLDRKDDWLEISAGDRRAGWVMKDSVTMVQ